MWRRHLLLKRSTALPVLHLVRERRETQLVCRHRSPRPNFSSTALVEFVCEFPSRNGVTSLSDLRLLTPDEHFLSAMSLS